MVAMLGMKEVLLSSSGAKERLKRTVQCKARVPGPALWRRPWTLSWYWQVHVYHYSAVIHTFRLSPVAIEAATR